MRSAAILCQERKKKLKHPLPQTFYFKLFMSDLCLFVFLNTQGNS